MQVAISVYTGHVSPVSPGWVQGKEGEGGGREGNAYPGQVGG